MKTSVFKSLFALQATVLVLVLLPACQPEVDPPVSSIHSDTAIASSNANTGCFQMVYFTIPQRNQINDPVNFGNCLPSTGNYCYKPVKSYTIGCLFEKDIFRLPCPGPGCPEDLVQRIRRFDIPNFFKLYLGDPDPEPNIPNILTNAFLFPVTQNVLGFQFYNKENNLTEQSFTLQKDLVLHQKMLRNMGIKGKIITAGTYPVLYNPKNGTYNALVAIR